MVSIPACHAGDRGSIPRRGAICLFFFLLGYATKLIKFEIGIFNRVIHILNRLLVAILKSTAGYLFDLVLYVPLTTFQLNSDGSPCVEPVLS